MKENVLLSKKFLALYSSSTQERSQDFPWGGPEVILLEKCSLLVDQLGRTSECYIEVKQKGGPSPPGPPSGYALATAISPPQPLALKKGIST